MADGDDPVRLLHAFPFDRENLFVHVFAAPVVFEGVDVEDERPAADPAGQECGGDGHPVVGVDNVKGGGAGEDAAGPTVANHLGDQVGAVNIGCYWKFLSFGKIEDAVAPRIHVGMEKGGKGAERQKPEGRLRAVVPVGVGQRDAGGGDKIQKRGRARLAVPRQDEGDPVAEAGQGRRHAVAGRAQAAAHPGRKFPSEHQDTHGLQPPPLQYIPGPADGDECVYGGKGEPILLLVMVWDRGK